MYLSSLSVEGFRGLKKLEVRFRNGLNVLVGPNNAGKTAIVDALRVLLSTGDDGALRMTDYDVNTVGAIKATQVDFRYVFRGLSPEEEADFLMALKPWVDEEGESRFEAHIAVRYSNPDVGGRMRVKRWCGDHEDNPVTLEMLEDLRAIYLPPLRDPAQGLKPSRGSQLSRLVQRLSTTATQEEVVKALAAFDAELKKKPPIAETQAAVSKRHSSMLGEVLSQKLDVNLSPSDFQRLAARLTLGVDGLEVEQNGLGFNNLIYMAVVLSELSLSTDAAYRALIVEEPEAHLHPQLQAVLLEYLKSVEQPAENERSVQVFVTSHSPHFAALADLDSIGCIYRSSDGIESFFPRDVAFDKTKKAKLQRYLNVTRADLFFARRIIFVEGTAELFIVQALAQGEKIDLRKHSVSVISVEGLNFDAFVPLFGKGQLKIPAAVITDSDPSGIYPKPGDSVTPSDSAQALAKAANDYVKPFFALKTLEYDLALIAANRATMLTALKAIHPRIGADLEAQVTAAGDDDKARVLYQGLFERGDKGDIHKGAYAQALAQSVMTDGLPLVAPDYIKKALIAATSA